MSLRKLHYENVSGTLVRREGLLSWRCPLCKAEGQSLEVMRTCPECGSKEATLPGAQPAPSFADAYQGAMEEVAIWKKRALEAEDLNRKFVAEINGPTYMGEQAQPAPSVPDGWLRAIDEALVTAHIGVANAEDTYEQAKAKLDSLLGWHTDVATDPAVNGGYRLIPIEPTEDMLRAMTDPFIAINGDNRKAFEIAYTAMLAAAPEAKL